jgi:hypothetical protein
MFTAEQRAGYLGASDMPFVMNEKTPEQLLQWWECKVGLREQEPRTWPMILGSIVGDAIVDYYEIQSGDAITRRQEVVPSPVNPRFRSTLDGFSIKRNAAIEAKFSSPFLDRDAIFATYYPQVALQMHCTDAGGGFLVVAQGTNDPIEIECVRDARYEAMLLDRAAAMLESMDAMQPPVAIDRAVMVPPEKWRTVDLTAERTNWSDEMMTLLLTLESTRAAAETHAETGKLARELVPDDVGKVITESHTISRNKNNALTIRRKAA